MDTHLIIAVALIVVAIITCGRSYRSRKPKSPVKKNCPICDGHGCIACGWSGYQL